MKYIAYILLFASFGDLGSAQDLKQLDSLKRAFANAKTDSVLTRVMARAKSILPHWPPDTNKVDLLNNIGGYYTWIYTDTALKYTRQALNLAQKLNFKNGEIQAYRTLGAILNQRGDQAGALSSQLRASQLAESTGNKTLWYATLISLGESYGGTQSALNYYYLVKTHGGEAMLTDFGREGLYEDIGETFFHLNKLDSAQYFIQQAYRLDTKIKAHWFPMYALMAQLSVKKGQLKKAIGYLYSFSIGADKGIDKLYCCGGLAALYKKTGQIDSAIYFAKKAISMQKQASMLNASLNPSKTLTEIYASKHQMDSAYKYQGIVIAITDSVSSRQKTMDFENVSFNEERRRQELAQSELEYKARVRIYILISAVAVFLLIAIILWRNYRQQKKSNLKIQKTLSELKSTQSQLVQREKMASLGELTAGIAHEIQNPLNFVNNFSDVNREMLQELKAESRKHKAERDEQLEVELINDLIDNEEKINHHGKRADFIVKGMLEHSRKSTGEKQPTNMNVLCDEFFKLSFHGMQAKDKSFNAEMITRFDSSLPKINVSQQDMGRVMLNLFNNAFYAVNQKAKTAGTGYNPMVEVSTKASDVNVIIAVKDNGSGIPENIKDKIMQPFFTTKPTGEGTGLGLSLTYDIIVKAHGGSIAVNTTEGQFTAFIVSLPL